VKRELQSAVVGAPNVARTFVSPVRPPLIPNATNIDPETSLRPYKRVKLEPQSYGIIAPLNFVRPLSPVFKREPGETDSNIQGRHVLPPQASTGPTTPPNIQRTLMSPPAILKREPGGTESTDVNARDQLLLPPGASTRTRTTAATPYRQLTDPFGPDDNETSLERARTERTELIRRRLNALRENRRERAASAATLERTKNDD
jgi:hypothetical protein